MENYIDPITDNVHKLDYLLMLFFLSLCGNVFFSNYVTEYVHVLTASLCGFYYISHKKLYDEKISSTQFSQAKLMLFLYIALFVAQYFVFNWNTVPGLINHLAKFIEGFFFVLYFGPRFRDVFFKTIYIISIIGLPLWIMQQYIEIPGYEWPLGKTIWIYCYREGIDIVRNCGFFWEPGAMGGYIAFLTLLFFNNLKELFVYHKKECLVIAAMLLSTQSTGAYLSFGLIILSYIAFSMRSKVKYIMLPMVMVLSMYLYNNVDFLSEKINDQNEAASEMKWGEYSSNRLGSFYFDLYYIVKHPIIGNGLHEKTRLADHPYVVWGLKDGELAYSGNGFSDTLAKWGLLFPIVFGALFWRNNTYSPIKKLAMLLLLSMILQGEMFLNYPLFLAFPFININNAKKDNYDVSI